MSSYALSYGVLAAPAAYAAVAAAAGWGDRHTRERRAERAGAGAAATGVVVAVVAAVATALHGASESPTIGAGGLGAAVRLDALSTVMLLMITVLAAVVFRFSCTYLDGDERRHVFLARLAATVAAVEVLVVAGNLALLVAAWIATSLALHELLVFYPHRPRARLAARKKFVAARTGDALLLAAVVVLYREFHTGDLSALATAIGHRAAAGWSLDAVGTAALCLAGAALLKSAQFPTHGWLVEVMETPTPVSALLHAGILNAGPFLAAPRVAPVLAGVDVAAATLIVVGGFTSVFASVSLLTQPSVKVALGYSSAAHMGFMLMICGLGVFPAALLHLVADSYYKAHAFLTSGSVIDEARDDRIVDARRLGRPARVAASLAIVLGTYLAIAAIFHAGVTHDPATLLVGAILVLGTTQLVAAGIDADAPGSAAARVAGLALGVTVAFFALERGARALLHSTVPEPAHHPGALVVLFAAVVAVDVAVVTAQIFEPARPPSRRRRVFAVHLRNGLYANALYDRALGALRVPAAQEPVR